MSSPWLPQCCRHCEQLRPGNPCDPPGRPDPITLLYFYDTSGRSRSCRRATPRLLLHTCPRSCAFMPGALQSARPRANLGLNGLRGTRTFTEYSDPATGTGTLPASAWQSGSVD